jgi:GxxExxY protein
MGKVVSTDEECYQIQCAVFDIYREMGCGFLEGEVFQECMGKELSKRGTPYVEHQQLWLLYKGGRLRQNYIPDL